jgi:hypothetical protein
MKKRITKEGFRIIEAWLRKEALRIRADQPLSAVILVQAACFDGTDIPACSSRDPHETKQGLGDPDARVGRGKSGGFLLGYQSLFLSDIEGFPLGHVEDSLNVNEKLLVEDFWIRSSARILRWSWWPVTASSSQASYSASSSPVSWSILYRGGGLRTGLTRLTCCP